MVETITPVVHGGRVRWARGVALHVLGATLTAAAFGAALGAIGALLGAPWGRAGALAIAGLAAVYAVGELPRLDVAVPQLRRQVPDWWRTYFSPSVAAFLYGAGLGVGFLTFLTHGTFVVVAAAALAIGDPAWGALVVGAFGIARGVTAIASSSVTTSDEGRELIDRLVDRSDRSRHLANGLAMLGLASLGLAAATRSGMWGGAGGWGELAVALLAGVFAWSTAAKLVDRRRWHRALAEHRLPRSLETAASSAVPAAELLVPVLGLLGLRIAAAVWGLMLVVVFTVEIVRVRVAVGPAVPCGCFGERRTVPTSIQLARNVGLAGLSAIALLGAHDEPLLAWPGAPRGDELLPAVLATVGIAVAGWAAWRSASWLRRARHA